MDLCAHERPFDKTKHKTFAQMNNICKAQRIKERQLRSKKTRQHMMPVLVWYKFDPDDSRQIILSNGTRIRQAIDGVGLYCTEGGRFYSLTRYGLRPIRVQLAPRKTTVSVSLEGVGTIKDSIIRMSLTEEGSVIPLII